MQYLNIWILVGKNMSLSGINYAFLSHNFHVFSLFPYVHPAIEYLAVVRARLTYRSSAV